MASANTFEARKVRIFLISSELYSLVVGTDISPGYKTDHSLVNLNIKFSTIKRGLEYWKFINELLKYENLVIMIKSKINDTVKLYAKDPLSIQKIILLVMIVKYLLFF